MESHFELKHKEITDKILRVFFKIVYAQFGYGFLEKVYENALALGLLLNFGPKPDFRRKAYSNDRKTITWNNNRESV